MTRREEDIVELCKLRQSVWKEPCIHCEEKERCDIIRKKYEIDMASQLEEKRR